jgi:hypothetical protein
LAGRFVTNAVSAAGSVLSGIGSALMPFQGALTAFAAAWIAERGVSGLLDAAAGAGDAAKTRAEDELADKGSEAQLAMAAWLTATYENGGWHDICDSTFLNYTISRNIELRYVPFLGMEAPQWFIMRCSDFLKSICANRVEHEKFGDAPIDLWRQHYSHEQYGQDAYYYAQQYATRRMPGGGIIADLLGWAQPSKEN